MPRPRANPPDPRNLLIAAGVLAVGGGAVWYLGRKRAAATGGTSALPGAPPTTFPDPGPQPVTLTAAQLRELTRLLTTGSADEQRDVALSFAYRAALYSSGVSQYSGFASNPLGLLISAILDPAENDINRRLRLPTGVAHAPPVQLRAFALWYADAKPAMRPLPFNLPRALVDAVNAQVARHVPAAPRLYVHAT